MPRSDWLKHGPRGEGRVLLDVEAMPFRAVALQAAREAATAERIAPSLLEVSVYRSDPDDPKPYNKDAYDLYEDLAARPDFSSLVEAPSTNVDANMLSFLQENVFLVSKSAGDSHWLNEDELPAIVQVAFSAPLNGAG